MFKVPSVTLSDREGPCSAEGKVWVSLGPSHGPLFIRQSRPVSLSLRWGGGLLGEVCVSFQPLWEEGVFLGSQQAEGWGSFLIF